MNRLVYALFNPVSVTWSEDLCIGPGDWRLELLICNYAGDKILIYFCTVFKDEIYWWRMFPRALWLITENPSNPWKWLKPLASVHDQAVRARRSRRLGDSIKHFSFRVSPCTPYETRMSVRSKGKGFPLRSAYTLYKQKWGSGGEHHRQWWSSDISKMDTRQMGRMLGLIHLLVGTRYSIIGTHGLVSRLSFCSWTFLDFREIIEIVVMLAMTVWSERVRCPVASSDNFRASLASLALHNLWDL